MYHLCFLDVWHTTLTLLPHFQLQEAKGTHSGVALGCSGLSCLNHLRLQHSWTSRALASSCQGPLDRPFPDLCSSLLIPSLIPTPLPFICVVGLAAQSVYCWCLSLCADRCSLLMKFYCRSILNTCYLLPRESHWTSNKKCSSTGECAVKRGVGQSLLFALSGQRLRSFEGQHFPLFFLFFKSTFQQGARYGCGGHSGTCWERSNQWWQLPPVPLMHGT